MLIQCSTLFSSQSKDFIGCLCYSVSAGLPAGLHLGRSDLRLKVFWTNSALGPFGVG